VAKTDLVPNFLANRLVAKSKNVNNNIIQSKKLSEQEEASSSSSLISRLVTSQEYDRLDIGQVNTLLALLSRKKELLRIGDQVEKLALLDTFLTKLRDNKLSLKAELDLQLSLLHSDIKAVDQTRQRQGLEDAKWMEQALEKGFQPSSLPDPAPSLGFNTLPQVGPSLACRRLRMEAHFSELSRIYLRSREADIRLGLERSPDSPVSQSKYTLPHLYCVTVN